jgi:hypothetical protein
MKVVPVPRKVAPPSVWDQVKSIRTETCMGVDNITTPGDAFTTKQFATQFGLPYQTSVQQVARLYVRSWHA